MAKIRKLKKKKRFSALINCLALPNIGDAEKKLGVTAS
jgi:hypothetical protein